MAATPNPYAAMFAAIKEECRSRTSTKKKNKPRTRAFQATQRQKLYRPKPGGSLVEKHPRIAAEWHPTLNGDVTPRDVSYGSAFRAHWQCSKADHTWDATVLSRTCMGSGCAICNGNFHVSEDNCLATLRPDLVDEWHPTRNTLTPRDVRCNSMKHIVWTCRTNEQHTWKATVADRHRGNGCPFCNGNNPNSIDPARSLAVAFPDVAAEWHPTLNGTSTPATVFAGSDKHAHWVCKFDPTHVWSAVIKSRTSLRANCPVCCTNKGEERLFETLEAHDDVLSYEPNSPLVCWCSYDRRNRTLKPDAKVILKSGIVCFIELDGPQHFDVVKHLHPHGEQSLRDQMKRDLAKNATIWKTGASLLRVAYHNYDNIEVIVDWFLKECTGTQVLRTSDNDFYRDHQNRVREMLNESKTDL